MRRLIAPVFISLAVLLAGCAHTLPPEKSAYAGEWCSDEVRLFIWPDGSLTYRRINDDGDFWMRGPIRFESGAMVVGSGQLATTFLVTQPPRLKGGVCKMTMDGMKLTRRQ